MKVNFTKKNEDTLKKLFLELGFSGEVLAGRLGANKYTVWDLLHNIHINTLRELNRNLKKEVQALRDQDEWSFTPYQKMKADKTEKWQAFVNLLIGFKLKKENDSKEATKKRKENAEKLITLKKLKTEAEIKELGELSADEIQKQIDELEGYED